ncbi:hypothetical protein [Candidatus Phytoplasma prunorum]|uniref:hypothetical protein n=1 Tax=Candidatus Phytoplasma prunorum TaxID=47565 RepID=UPI002FF2F8D2
MLKFKNFIMRVKKNFILIILLTLFSLFFFMIFYSYQFNYSNLPKKEKEFFVLMSDIEKNKIKK